MTTIKLINYNLRNFARGAPHLALSRLRVRSPFRLCSSGDGDGGGGSDLKRSSDEPPLQPAVFPFQIPSCHKIIRKDNLIILYDQSKRIPVLVAESLTKETLRGNAKRSSRFYEETSIPTAFRSTKGDYKGSGFDRGHMAPAGNNKGSNDRMRQTFSLSNIVPQDQRNNQGIWNELEVYCRSLCSNWDAVHVITGQVMRPVEINNNNGNTVKVVTYKVIGANEVAVPTHLYKVVLCQSLKRSQKKAIDDAKAKTRRYASSDFPALPRAPSPNYDACAETERLALHSFLIPNEDVGSDKKFDDFRTPLRDIEKFSGFQMFREWRASVHWKWGTGEEVI